MAAFPRLCFAVKQSVSETLTSCKKDEHFAWSGKSIFLISPYSPNIARKWASATLRVRLRTMMTLGPSLEPSWSLGTGERDTERISSSESRLLPSLRGDSERPRDIFRLSGRKLTSRTAALSSHLLEPRWRKPFSSSS